MIGLAEARKQLAAAVSTPKVHVHAYPPDSASAPCGWIDAVAVDYEQAASFCLPGRVTAQVLLVGQRHDRPGSTELLESLIQSSVDALTGIPGVEVTGAESGSADLNGEVVPSVALTIAFHLSD